MWNYKTGNPALIYLIKKQGLNKSEIGRMLQISNATLHKYLNNPYLLSIYQFIALSGLLKIDYIHLLQLVTQSKPQAKKNTWFNTDEDVIKLYDSIKNESIKLKIESKKP